MRVALLADIHSNHMAFEAVLEDLKDKNIDEVYLLGDYLFGGHGSNETVDLLMGLKESCIISGNIDVLIGAIESEAEWVYPVSKQIYESLGDERLSFMKSLEATLTLDLGGLKVHLCHNPSDLEMFQLTHPIKREHNKPNIHGLNELSKTFEHDVCLFGHYHLFMDETVNGKRFICPGSVGLPFNGESTAQYMILEIMNGDIVTFNQSVNYDLEAYIEGFERHGYLEAHHNWSNKIIKSLITGHCHM